MATNWTKALRDRMTTTIPAEHLLPDKQPTYVRSSMYLLGAFTLAALVVIVLSGIVLAIFGPQWWHTNGLGHFMNSLHFWSVQAFFFFMVLHLWGMFFQGAWRDGRGRTWVAGGITFLVSLVAGFTGFLSQGNFDSQWIGVSAKDLINAIGVGGLFNPLNFGQMYSVHVIVLPLVVIGLVALHLFMVRMRGVVRPYPVAGEQRVPYHKGMTQEQYYQNVPMAPYDLVREVTAVTLVAVVVIVALASVFASPDEKPLTLQGVAQSSPVEFTTVSLAELAGSSAIAGYGPPYNTATGSVQYLGPISLQQASGVHIPIDTAKTYVLQPLSTVKNPDVTTALATFTAAKADQQATWEANYATALGNNSTEALDANGHVITKDCTNIPGDKADCGPLPGMFGGLLDIARTGALDGLLVSGNGQFYQTDYTKPLLFLNENALPSKAATLNLSGADWGIMNETGKYPGQPWLWLYTFWYQVPVGPFNGPNADVGVAVMVLLLSLVFVFVPYIPGLNRLPEFMGIHRIIWRQHYRAARAAVATPTTAPPVPGQPLATPGPQLNS